MAYTEQHLAALRSALARGERRVTFEGRTVEYRSIEELEFELRDVLHGLMAQADVAGLGPRSTPDPQDDGHWSQMITQLGGLAGVESHGQRR